MTEPEYLYRYRQFNDFSKDILRNNRLWFSSPKDFNDPFDSKIHIDFGDSNIDDLIKIYRTFINHNDETLTEEELRIVDTIFFATGNHKIFPDKIKDVIQQYKNCPIDTIMPLENILISGKENIIKFFQRISHESLGIICCNESKDNILMWSHYADSHKGFCLQFNKSIIHGYSSQSTWGKCLEVEYEQSFYKPQELLDSANKPDEFVKKTIFRKTPVWKYEKEWRIVAVRPNEEIPDNEQKWIKNKDRYISFPPEMLTGVIFGCAMGDDDRKELENLVKSNPKLGHVRFHEAKKKPNEFGLNIEEIK